MLDRFFIQIPFFFSLPFSFLKTFSLSLFKNLFFFFYTSFFLRFSLKKKQKRVTSLIIKMSKQMKSQDLGFPTYMVACATVAALSGFNVGWHISMCLEKKKRFNLISFN